MEQGRERRAAGGQNALLVHTALLLSLLKAGGEALGCDFESPAPARLQKLAGGGPRVHPITTQRCLGHQKHRKGHRDRARWAEDDEDASRSWGAAGGFNNSTGAQLGHLLQREFSKEAPKPSRVGRCASLLISDSLHQHLPEFGAPHLEFGEQRPQIRGATDAAGPGPGARCSAPQPPSPSRNNLRKATARGRRGAMSPEAAPSPPLRACSWRLDPPCRFLAVKPPARPIPPQRTETASGWARGGEITHIWSPEALACSRAAQETVWSLSCSGAAPAARGERFSSAAAAAGGSPPPWPPTPPPPGPGLPREKETVRAGSR